MFLSLRQGLNFSRIVPWFFWDQDIVVNHEDLGKRFWMRFSSVLLASITTRSERPKFGVSLLDSVYTCLLVLSRMSSMRTSVLQQSIPGRDSWPAVASRSCEICAEKKEKVGSSKWPPEKKERIMQACTDWIDETHCIESMHYTHHTHTHKYNGCGKPAEKLIAIARLRLIVS